MAAGKSQEVSFSVAKEDAGSYSVAVDGLSASFTVLAPAPSVVPDEVEEVPVPAPFNWPLVGGIIAGGIIVGLLIYFFVFRRRVYLEWIGKAKEIVKRNR
ncbi:unnamed protein product [marine sediment metagenome]|uniref:CARDB domain-containing protein n=1 Tax=marine sediment metagenome TaxID=412755 RepID=X1TFM7_9ZZZZ